LTRSADAVLLELQTRGIKLGLDKVRLLLQQLGSPQRDVQIAQVAGTNGKGSVVFGLEAIARASGVRTGLFTSPHLVSPTERVRVDGVDLGQAEFEQRVVALAHRLDRDAPTFPELAHVTYFEFLFGLAMEAFRDHGVALVILEVGMGGRLDATTTAGADVTCITSIDLDHEFFLGTGLAAIAAEKVGIARAGVPLLVGPVPEAAERGIRVRALEVGAPLQAVEPRDGVVNGMWGEHQRINAALSLGLAEALGLPTGEPARAALARTRVPARCEIFPGVPQLVIDGAHNPAATRALAAALADHPASGATDLLVSVGCDKDLEGVLAPLVPLARTVHVTEYRDGRTPTPAQEIAAAVRALGGTAQVHPDAETALMAARGGAVVGERLLVAGSLFLAGEVRALVIKGGPG
jgi:dihydrofolate synthase / folylpolyglutamate synthase